MDIVEYLNEHSPRFANEAPGIPIVIPAESPITASNIKNGAQLYQNLAFAKCHGARELAMLYVVTTGYQRRQLPTDFPPWKLVHEQVRSWRDGGVRERAGVGRNLECHLADEFALDAPPIP